MKIEGGIYPVSPEKQKMINIFRFLQFTFIFLLFAGDWLFAQMNITPPTIYKEIMGYKMILFGLTFFIGNTLINGMTTTGAFEVYVDGTKIYSKLEKGRMPEPEELFVAINAKAYSR
mmetsp:Transcript_52475/g.60313  ORF Transcript_52475/g.60313 Transcript_52475/m.60313 type:complete len:117 (-) Transcript_52475:31-381(-)